MRNYAKNVVLKIGLNVYYKKEGSKVICQLCTHYCKLKEGQVGACGVNENLQNKLHSKVYGYPAALHIDPIEKKPLYHFLPHTNTLSLGTIGCNFKCPFCQNWQISQTKKIEKNEYISPNKIVQLALYHHCKSISYTYNEPTIFWPYIKDIAIKARIAGLKNLMVSNGFYSQELLPQITKYIDAINIDIKSFDKNYYKTSLKGNLETILTNSAYLKSLGIHIEITTLIIPSITTAQIEHIAEFIVKELGDDTPWHLSAYHPNYKMQNGNNTSLEILKKYHNIAKNKNIQNVYLGNIQSAYK